MAPPTTPVEIRLWSKIDRRGPDECWNWTGRAQVRGRGKMWIGSRTDGTRRAVFVTRLVCELCVGPIADGLNVLHKCDNPSCCNPQHLFLGTPQDNVRDMLTKGRQHNQRKTHCPQGHAYDESNTRLKRGRRECIACTRAYDRARRKKVA